MKAVIINQYGPPEVLEYTEVSQPQLKPDSLLVKIHATSVNPVDFKIRKGQLRFITGFIKPKIKILGFDVAGEVIETGGKVKGFKRGDLVFALISITRGGANAEYVSIPERTAALKPDNLSFTESAAVPLASLTALQALRDRGKISPGKTVLINGASGGVGNFAVQIAKALGTVVTGVCSSKNIELVKSLGAEHVVDYTKEDFTRSHLLYDIIFDAVANRSFAACKNTLTPKGIYVTTVPSLSTLFCVIQTSLFPGKKATFVTVKSNGEDLNFIRELIEADKIKPVIDRSFPLSKVAEAHMYCEAGHTRGKNVITI